jgi:hypothetical protein
MSDKEFNRIRSGFAADEMRDRAAVKAFRADPRNMPTSGGGFARASSTGPARIASPSLQTREAGVGFGIGGGGAVPQRELGPIMATQPGGGVAPGSTRAALLGGGGKGQGLRDASGRLSQIAITKASGLKPSETSKRAAFVRQYESPELTADERTERGRLHQLAMAKLGPEATVEAQRLRGQQAAEGRDFTADQAELNRKASMERVSATQAAITERLQKQGKLPGTPEYDTLRSEALEQAAISAGQTEDKALFNSLMQESVKAKVDLLFNDKITDPAKRQSIMDDIGRIGQEALNVGRKDIAQRTEQRLGDIRAEGEQGDVPNLDGDPSVDTPREKRLRGIQRALSMTEEERRAAGISTDDFLEAQAEWQEAKRQAKERATANLGA